MSIKTDLKELVLIAGSGRLSTGIASELSLQGTYTVLIIDDYMGAFARLKKKLRASVVGVDVTDTEALERCGIETAQYFIAATDNNNTNIMIAQIAKEIYRVPNVIAIIQNDENKVYLLKELDILTVCPNLLAIDQLKSAFGMIHTKKERSDQ
jgi:trk system potassium uptake protein TrkA